MARRPRCRRICAEPLCRSFFSAGCESDDSVTLSVDEYEVIRLIDREKFTHGQCAEQMDISRTTVTEIYESARNKLADFLVTGKQLNISGGNYRLCGGTYQKCRYFGKDENIMKIAVTYENGEVFQHFGHTSQFKLYDVENGEIKSSEVIDTAGSGHGALAGFLSGHSVDTLICGGIGGGAQNALTAAGIKFYGGVSGSADEAVKALISGKLEFDPDIKCSHHEHSGGHDCGHHSCGEDKHGCAGN